MHGGLGDDAYAADTVADIVGEVGGGGRVDTVESSIDHTLGTDVEHMLLTCGDSMTDTFCKNTTGITEDANDFLIYNTTTGASFYDANVNGVGAAIQCAT